MRVFARNGFHTSRVGDVAAEAGVAHGLLYHYFSSKEELLATMFASTWRALLEALRDASRSRTSRPASSCGRWPRSSFGPGAATRTWSA